MHYLLGMIKYLYLGFLLLFLVYLAKAAADDLRA